MGRGRAGAIAAAQFRTASNLTLPLTTHFVLLQDPKQVFSQKWAWLCKHRGREREEATAPAQFRTTGPLNSPFVPLLCPKQLFSQKWAWPCKHRGRGRAGATAPAQFSTTGPQTNLQTAPDSPQNPYFRGFYVVGVAYGHAHHAHPVEDAGEGTPDPPTEFRPDRSTHLAAYA